MQFLRWIMRSIPYAWNTLLTLTPRSCVTLRVPTRIRWTLNVPRGSWLILTYKKNCTLLIVWWFGELGPAAWWWNKVAEAWWVSCFGACCLLHDSRHLLAGNEGSVDCCSWRFAVCCIIVVISWLAEFDSLYLLAAIVRGLGIYFWCRLIQVSIRNDREECEIVNGLCSSCVKLTVCQ